MRAGGVSSLHEFELVEPRRLLPGDFLVLLDLVEEIDDIHGKIGTGIEQAVVALIDRLAEDGDLDAVRIAEVVRW